MLERLRRWSRSDDHDEVEIPVNETLLSVNNAEEIITTTSTSFNFDTTESNGSIIENVVYLSNSTDLTTMESSLEENTTIVYPLLRQDLIELNQTTVSVLENVSEENRTETNEISSALTESMDLNQTIRIESELTTTESSVFSSQNTDQVELTTTITTTTIEINSTISSDFNDTFSIPTSDEWIIHSNITQKDAFIINEEIYTNDTEPIPFESNETSIISSKSLSIPICDQSCQCLKECPYGFEILNDTCLCNPPCQVSD